MNMPLIVSQKKIMIRNLLLKHWKNYQLKIFRIWCPIRFMFFSITLILLYCNDFQIWNKISLFLTTIRNHRSNLFVRAGYIIRYFFIFYHIFALNIASLAQSVEHSAMRKGRGYIIRYFFQPFIIYLHSIYLLSSAGRAFRHAERSWLYHPVFFSAFYHIFAFNIASLAQLVEQLIRNEQVVGSSPIGGSRRRFNELRRLKKLKRVEQVEE